MAKDYSRRRQTRQRSNAPRQFFMVIAAFLCGYLTATVFDFASVMSWLNKNVLNQNKTAPAEKIAVKPAELPKPKFEFYTLLSKDNSAPVAINRSNPAALSKNTAPTGTLNSQSTTQLASQRAAMQAVKVVESKPVSVASNALAKESYSIQIASFNKRADAEHVKALLVLKGFDVNIVAVPQQKITWYRVIIGPFTSRLDAEKAQIAVAKSERMHGMIRRM